MKIDIGKSFGSLIITISLINAVSHAIFDDLAGLIISLFQLIINAIIGLMYWKHIPAMLTITRSICQLSFVLIPIIIAVGILSGKPLTVSLPFYEDKIDSAIGKASMIFIFSLWITVIYIIFSSRKAEIEFTPSA